MPVLKDLVMKAVLYIAAACAMLSRKHTSKQDESAVQCLTDELALTRYNQMANKMT
jgi:hypothetical protein